ncbi:hypothetical protein MKK70_22895 [Methylobacterium sp. E-041]|uniref:hypothetical protein n=1 Tax=Methylobacterium sp. E-041 TaxID=2836573 RepID=UPI001FBBC408|nr:hypothetical protein [Methylobacterium sp. E-041]MCJ2108169.1 hypothetical protein [Methylobacterium sp. E-041]
MRKRQEILDTWLGQTADPELRDFAAQAPRTGEQFEIWISQIIVADLEQEFHRFQTEGKRKTARERAVT